jgi:hypothetical protein
MYAIAYSIRYANVFCHWLYTWICEWIYLNYSIAIDPLFVYCIVSDFDIGCWFMHWLSHWLNPGLPISYFIGYIFGYEIDYVSGQAIKLAIDYSFGSV